RYQKPVLQSYRLSSHLRETGRWSLRGEGQWRVGIRSSRQNLEAVGTGPWISRLCSFQIRWATRSPLLCRCPVRNLGFAAEPGDHCRRPLRAPSGAKLPSPPSSVMKSRRRSSRSFDHLVGAGEQTGIRRFLVGDTIREHIYFSIPWIGRHLCPDPVRKREFLASVC